jgi:D-glycero-alpha-D-manno-heptose-7-phosphate kinase
MTNSRNRTRASAPTRIDLAGGTLDIWPLNLLVGHALTVNVAIDRRASATISRSGNHLHHLVSEDLARELLVEPERLAARSQGQAPPTDLPLHEEVLRQFPQKIGLRLGTASGVPAGSGLGGSSALAVSLIATMLDWTGESLDAARIAPLARDIEARILQVPTGTQDHLAAIHGGVAAIHYEPGAAVREPLSLDLEEFESRGTLAYLGASRASSRANWDMVRRALDGDRATRAGLEAIAGIALSMRAALVKGDLDEAARLLAAEWDERRGLSPEVSTEETERAVASARKAGASGAKICGAGGGGCLFVMGPVDARRGIGVALESSGCRLLDFHVDTRGLDIESAGDRNA